MPSGKKPSKKKNVANSVRSVPSSDLTQKEREKKVVFRGQTITYEEQLALADLEKELHRKIYNFGTIHDEREFFSYKATDGKVTKLEIRDRGLKRVPESIRNLKSLKELTLSYNKLTILPESMGSLKSVTELFLHGNQLIALPDSIGGLESLERLWLEDNKLTELPNSLLILPKLKDLQIKNNPLNKASIKIWEQVMKQTGRMEDIGAKEKAALEDLEKVIGEPIPRVDRYISSDSFGYVAEAGHVTKLGLHSKIKTVPPSIGQLKWLKELGLAWNAGLTLPESIGDLQMLDKLDLWQCRLETIPEAIWNLKSLTDLNLPGNHLETLPEAIGNLKSLLTLNLTDNYLKTIPDSIGNLESLRWLQLEGNQLKTLPESLLNLSNLVYFTIKDNPLTETSMELATQLSARATQLFALEREAEAKKTAITTTEKKEKVGETGTKEKRVVFRGQTITYEEQLALEDLEKELGRAIGAYRRTEVKQFAYSADNGKVTALEIRGVGLKRIPESIRNLKSLKVLTLSYNELTTLPESIGDLKSVAIILLHGNKLTSLPSSIGGLESLRCLWLQENQLTELPDSFFKLQLHEFKIGNNPLNEASIKRRMKTEKEGKTGTNQKEAEELKEKKPGIATYQGCDIIIFEHKALKDLENLLKEPIPHTPIPQRLYVLNFPQEQIEVCRIGFGFRTSDAKVIGLGLNGKGLTTLPESIADLKGLKYLQLEDNQFVTLPKYLGNLELLNFLYLNKNKLTTLPESIGNLQFLRILELSDNRLKSLPETIENMISVRILNLNNNKLSELPASMRNLTVLNTLSVENNQLTSFPDAFSELKSLYSLNLSNNQFKQLPMWIGEIELALLKVEKNALTMLPTSIGNLQKLQKLELKGNLITTLPDSICELKTMWMLDLRDNQLEQLPESIGELKALKNLLLENNRLTTLPESIGELKDLWDLNLDHNQLTTLPESIANLQKLDTLLLRDNQLTRLPENFGNLKSLKTLNLNDNQMMNLPQSLIQLSKLESLSIENNPLTQSSYKILEQLENRGVIIECAEYLKLKVRYNGKPITPEEKTLLEDLEKVISEIKIENAHVKSLSLSGKGLATVPDSVMKLTWLLSLDLSNNQLTTLPEAIGNLKALQILSSQKNQLTALPESIGSLKSLGSLLLDENQLTELPETIGNLTSLKYLYLTCNRLQSLPKSIGNLNALLELSLGMNELTALPASIENLKSKDLHIYLRGNSALTPPAGLSGSFQSKMSLGNFSMQVKLNSKTLELGGLKEYFTWKIQQDRPWRDTGSGVEVNTVDVEVGTQCAGPWLAIKVRVTVNAKEWFPYTDSASGDDVSFISGHDWIGLIENVLPSVARPEELDHWALYTTSHSYTQRDWAVDIVGSYVETIDEHGKVIVILVDKYFEEKPQSEYTEYIQLKQ